MLPLDGAPGGTFSIAEEGMDPPSGMKGTFETKQSHICFISTVSALGFPYSTWQTTLAQPLNSTLITQHSPFQHTFVPSSNELHVRFNSSASFLYNHLVLEAAISGSGTICGIGTYTLNNPNLQGTWSVTSGFTITSQNSTSAIVQANGLNGQSGTLTAIVNGISISTTIHACYVPPPCPFGFSWCNGSSCHLCNPLPPPNCPYYSWCSGMDCYNCNPPSICSACMNSPCTCNNGGGDPPPPPACPICGGNPRFCPCDDEEEPIWPKSSPNPVSDILLVDVDVVSTTSSQSANTQARTKQTFNIKLYNNQGFILRQATATSGKIEFDVNNLPEGTYYLHIESNGEIKKEQIIIKRK
jgi:hypothetical protein